MRLPIQVPSKRTVKMIRMKPIPLKKRELKGTKPFEDSVSETISFVIKGKFTPLKSTSIGRSRIVCKKSPALLNKKGVTKKCEKKIKSKEKISTQNNKNLPAVEKMKKKDALLSSACLEQHNNETNVSNVPQKVKNELIAKPIKKAPRGNSSKALSKTGIVNKRSKSVNKTEPAKQKKLKDVATKKGTKILKKIAKVGPTEHKKSINKLVKSKPKKSVLYTNQLKEAKDNKKVKLATKSKFAKSETKPVRQSLAKNKLQKTVTPSKRRKSHNEDNSTDDTCTSDEMTLDLLLPAEEDNKTQESQATTGTSKKTKNENSACAERKRKKPGANCIPLKKPKNILSTKSKVVVIKKKLLNNKNKLKEDTKTRKLKLLGLWNSPKRHRVASLNALAKVHCLYENETRSTILDAESIKTESGIERRNANRKETETPPASTRILRSVPGLRAVGKHWDLDDTTSSSSDDNESSAEGTSTASESKQKIEVSKVEEPDAGVKKEKKRRRNRTEIIMDLKDMVVRKRMASLNATAILAASYSVEKRTLKSPKSEDTDSYETDESFKQKERKPLCEEVKEEDDKNVIEVCATPNKKVAVILNQDTDVTITGVYVNSTTRSTHHEGYCSIAGMQYRISATSHTQTAATAVATETLLQSSSSSQENVSSI